MNKSFIYLLGLLYLTVGTSLIVVAAQGNNDTALNNITQESTISSNASVNPPHANRTFSATGLGEIGKMENISDIASSNTSKPQFEGSNVTYLALGSGSMENESGYRIAMPTRPVINASEMGYIIQGTPHGYV